MTSKPPVRLTVDRGALIALERVFEAASPAEGCALLLGSTGCSWHLQRIWPTVNNWPEPAERTRRFSLDPREQLLAQRWARDHGLRVLGSAHSHPCTAPMPSRLDLELTVPPALMLIAGREQEPDPSQAKGGWSWGCWWLQEQRDGAPLLAPLQLPWTMAD